MPPGPLSRWGLTPSDRWFTVPPVTTTETKTSRPHVLRVRVSDDEKKWLERVAAADDRSVHYILRQALNEFWNNHKDDA